MTNKPTDFGSKLKELEAITDWFESDDVDLNEALKKFERGMQLADDLKKELAEVENRVETIKQKFDGASVQPAAAEVDDISPAADIPEADEPTLF